MWSARFLTVVLGVVGIFPYLSAAAGEAVEQRPDIEQNEQGQWVLKTQKPSSAVLSTRYFQPGKNCVDAVIEIRLVGGEAQFVVKEFQNPREGSRGGAMKGQDGMHFTFGEEGCRIGVSITPIR